MRDGGRRLLAVLGSTMFVAAGWAAGCASEPTGGAKSAPAVPIVPLTGAPEPADAAPAPPAPVPPASAEPAPPPPEPVLGADHRSVAPCETDADCGWDDPCLPTRCLGAVPRNDIKCAESKPEPGACLCISGGCTLKPSQAPVASGPCEDRGCIVDRAGGQCVADTRGVKWNLRTNPGVNQGPSCDCVTPASGCTFTWYEPVPCKTERDCWVEELPRPHPVKRPPHLRGRDFEACSDGEISPQCGKAGYCVLGPGWLC